MGLALGELSRLVTEATYYHARRNTMDDMMMKGWRTVFWNGVVVVGGTAFLQWAIGFNWVDAVGPVYAMWIVAGVNVLLRMVTNTPIGVK